MKNIRYMQYQSNVIIVGIGVIGLTNAIRLAQAGYRVLVVSNLSLLESTSGTAAAFWLPVLSGNDPRIPNMATGSLAVFRELAKTPSSGVRRIRLHVVYTVPPASEELNWLLSVPTRPLEKSELPVGCALGYEAHVYRMEMSLYLPFLKKMAKDEGVQFETATVHNIEELNADIVVNCSGVFARHLVGDELVTPIRGQVLHVKTPPALAEATVCRKTCNLIRHSLVFMDILNRILIGLAKFKGFLKKVYIGWPS